MVEPNVSTTVTALLDDVRRGDESALSRLFALVYDKLVEIAKTSTVPSLRLEAINALTRRKDPRLAQLLDEIMNGVRKP